MLLVRNLARRWTLPLIAAVSATACASPTHSCSCPAPAAGLQLDARNWTSAHKGATTLRVCERGACSSAQVAVAKAHFLDGRPLTDGAAIDLSLQLLDQNGKTLAAWRRPVSPVQVVTKCCGATTTGWLFVGTVTSSGQLDLEQPH